MRSADLAIAPTTRQRILARWVGPDRTALSVRGSRAVQNVRKAMPAGVIAVAVTTVRGGRGSSPTKVQRTAPGIHVNIRNAVIDDVALLQPRERAVGARWLGGSVARPAAPRG